MGRKSDRYGESSTSNDFKDVTAGGWGGIWKKAPKSQAGMHYPFSNGWKTPENSEGDGDQRVEAPAVAPHDALGEAQRPARIGFHLVAVAAGGEHIHGALAHDAHDQERRLDVGRAVGLTQHHGKPDDVAVALPLVDVYLSQRGGAVLHHAPRVGAGQAPLEAPRPGRRRPHLLAPRGPD